MMRLEDVRREAVREAIDDMPAQFRTKHLSDHEVMVDAHRSFHDHDKYYYARVGSYLSRYDSELDIRCVDRCTNAVWEKVGEMERHNHSPASAKVHVTTLSLPRVQVRRSSSPVRDGHYQSLGFMLSSEFQRIKDLFESETEIGGVYFRPTDGRITVVDLHPHSPKPRIGVGRDPYIRCGATAAELAVTMDERVAYIRDVRVRQAQPSRENQFEALMIREAQGNHLHLPGCSDRLRFIYSQWRMDPTPSDSQRFTDLLAVDMETQSLVILELKPEPDNSAFPQVSSYMKYFESHWDDLKPFFVQVAQVMGALYGCRELLSLNNLSGSIVPLVAWPSANGGPIVNGFDEVPKSVIASTQHPNSTSMTGALSATSIGPQCPSDSLFRARMRFHQSWYRATVLDVPCGTGPEEKSQIQYGNMLRRSDGELGLNFTLPGAFTAAKRRMEQQIGTVEPFRLLHNMLSSQPMCFNLFGPFALESGLATMALQALLGIDEVRRVQELVFEYAPQPQYEYLDDGTAFDAFISYERPDCSLGFLGIETKLTEPFSRKHYDKSAYRRWTERVDSPWSPEAWSHLSDIDHNQLWRGHMLAIAMTKHPQSPYVAGRFALVRHPGDAECTRVVEKYRRLLKPQDQTFVDLPLDSVVETWEQALPACADWLAKFKLRYLDLAASEDEWKLRGCCR